MQNVEKRRSEAFAEQQRNNEEESLARRAEE
jgi:hypothetical protein